jgi:hypothetical protein
VGWVFGGAHHLQSLSPTLLEQAFVIFEHFTFYWRRCAHPSRMTPFAAIVLTVDLISMASKLESTSGERSPPSTTGIKTRIL